MNIRRPSLKQLIFFVALGLIGQVGGFSFAAQKKPLENKSPAGPSQNVPVFNVNKAAARPSTVNPKASTLRKPTQTAEDARPKKSHRRIKTNKKVVPKAVIEPRTDLIHYGILEDSQRYDPRPRADSASVPSPQTLDLTHDHFQELDRNLDGKVDPVERAFGRIDMDRDLHTRTLQ